MEELMAVRNAMVRTTDLRQPMDLGEQLLGKSGLSSDVGQAMVELLQVCTLSTQHFILSTTSSTVEPSIGT